MVEHLLASSAWPVQWRHFLLTLCMCSFQFKPSSNVTPRHLSDLLLSITSLFIDTLTLSLSFSCWATSAVSSWCSSSAYCHQPTSLHAADPHQSSSPVHQGHGCVIHILGHCTILYYLGKIIHIHNEEQGSQNRALRNSPLHFYPFTLGISHTRFASGHSGTQTTNKPL